MMTLGEETEFPISRTVAVHVDQSGHYSLQAWKPGKYVVRTAAGRTLSAQAPIAPAPIELNGPWRIAFPTKTGVDKVVNVPDLQSWSQSTDNDVKYFSGTATYSKSFTIPGDAAKGRTSRARRGGGLSRRGGSGARTRRSRTPACLGPSISTAQRRWNLIRVSAGRRLENNDVC